jgi:hypothetical protein
MATLDQHAYNIRNIGRAGLGNSDDERLQIRQIKFWIQGYRAQAIFEYTNAGKNIDPQLITDFGILPLIEVDKADSDGCPPGIDWGCTIKKVTIPKLIDLPHNRALLFIGKIDKQTMFQRDEANTHYFSKATRYANLISRYFIVGQTVYIELSDKDSELKYINGRGVEEDPSKSLKQKFDEASDACIDVCFDDAKDEYPMPMRMYPYVAGKILQQELGLTLQTTEDLLNNAQNLNRTQNEVQANQQ